MKCAKFPCLVAGILFVSALANAGTIKYTCDPTIDMATCNYLNTTVAGIYSSTFTNANANIYITFGATDLASTTTIRNQVSYGTYTDDLAAEAAATGSPVQIAAVASLTNDLTPYGGDEVKITAALASVFGITARDNGNGQIAGIMSDGTTACYAPVGSDVLPAGCYAAFVTMSNTAGTWYYDNVVGPQAPSTYDFYGTVEHETDEVLGTSSCIATTDASGNLTDPCDASSGNRNTGNPSAADLFRYNSNGNLALDTTYIGMANAAAGAYFSYNGGATNGAKGVGGTGKLYNVSANGNDYADFLASTPSCATNQAIQDATGCKGVDGGLNILNDGGGEINILNAVGYTLTPEPGTMVLFGAGLAAIGLYRRRRRQA